MHIRDAQRLQHQIGDSEIRATIDEERSATRVVIVGVETRVDIHGRLLIAQSAVGAFDHVAEIVQTAIRRTIRSLLSSSARLRITGGERQGGE